MIDYEKLGVFYLGKEYDQSGNKLLDDNFILYDSKDLTTHAMCVGMTGSGKTGLCIALLEEAAVDKVPAIIIDPKGDLSDLLLTFPDLKPEDFKKWLSQDEADKKGISIDELAKKKADDWEKGLLSWNQNKDRIKRLKDSVTFDIYTPGSNAGKQVSVLSSFNPPEDKILNDFSLRETILSISSAVLNLIGISADPIKSKETILLTNIIEFFWKQKKGLTLPDIIQSIINPPIQKVGVFDVESFYPSKERFELAMLLNNLLASPGFSGWMEGEKFSIADFLYTAEGKPKHSIFSIAHLNDTERMFFVTLLLNEVINWMRMQPGTTSLRAMVYMDEIFGYFPPVANPPSKNAMLTLLKQARAFGLGIVLATQNPVDIDYKGLSNIGTWFIGRLQTEQDKNRVIDGLKTAMQTEGKTYSPQELGNLISRLDNRIFLMNNVHENAPVIFQTRWVMSFLSGPLTRVQISELMKNKTEVIPSVQKSAVNKDEKISGTKPIIPSEINQVYVPVRSSKPAEAKLMYKSFLYGKADINIVSDKNKIDASITKNLFFPIMDTDEIVKWESPIDIEIPGKDLLGEPEEESAGFSAIPKDSTNPKSFDNWNKEYGNFLYRQSKIVLYKSKESDMISNAGESEKDFRIRLGLSLRELRDESVEKIKSKYETKINSLQEKIRKSEQKLQDEKAQYDQQKINAAISIGTTLLGAFLGRKTFSTSNASRAGSAISRASKTYKEKMDVNQVQDDINNLNKQIEELNNQLNTDIQSLSSSYDPDNIKLEDVIIRPTKSGINVKSMSLAWLPHWITEGESSPAYE
jgi:DNA helicase HerA-like ATPase